VIVSALLGASVALADKPVKLRPADCEALDEAAFRGFVLDAQAALDRDDAALNAQILAELDERMPCLTFAPAPRVWADLLVSKAIAAFAAGGDWQVPLAAAVRVRPQIDRGVGSAHPIGKWEPAEAAPLVSPGPVPAEVALWVDGLRVTELPPVAGLHLVQRESDGQWISRVLVDEGVPPDWLTGVVVHPLTIEIDGQVSGGYEVFGIGQIPSWHSDYVANGSEAKGGPTLALRGMVRVRRAAILADASGRFLSFQPLELGHADAALGGRVRPRLYAGLGAGVYQYPTFLGRGCFTAVCLDDDGEPMPEDELDDGRSITVDWVQVVQVSGLLAWYGKDLDAPVRGGAAFSTRGALWTASGWWAHRLEGNWFYGFNGSFYGAQLRQIGTDAALAERRVRLGGITGAIEVGTRFGVDVH
jgi:hypothetical protein